MKKYLGLGFAAMAAISCGGGSGKGAASASSTSGGTSQISITTLAADGSGASSKFTISGPAYGIFDSASGAFHVFVIDGSGGPAPDCDHLKDLATGHAKARIVDLYLNKNVTVPGKVDAAGALAVDATGDAPQMAQGNVDGVALDFKSVDAKSFDATVVSASGSASGSLHGTVCDGSKLRGAASGDAAAGAQAPTTDAPTQQSPTGFALEMETSPGSRMTVPIEGNSMVKLDPKTKILAIATWPDTSHFHQDPPAAAPTCDVFTGAKKSLGKNGSVTLLFVEKVAAHASGSYRVFAGKQVAVDPSTPDAIDSAGKVDAHLTVLNFDDKAFAGTFISPASMNDLQGNIAASVCPNGHVDAPAVGTTKATKKKKSK